MPSAPLIAYGRWLADAPADWPDAAIDGARRAFVDIVGVAVRGAVEDAPRRAFETVRAWGEGGSAVVGMAARLAPPWAALVNGTSAHALDFDDNFEPARAHATAVLAPAILALAETEGRSGRDCLDAYIAGLQVLGLVGEAMNPSHRLRGWHATSTLGAIGAAAAGARLLRLDAARSSHALSIATSMAGGFMSQFGTMTKPLHAGLAASAGVMAASLARGGVSAGARTLDGPHSLAGLMSEDGAFETRPPGERLFILSHGLKAKRYPNCASAHRAMDALLGLIEAHNLSRAEVREVVVRAPASQFANLMYADPRDPLQAKFSLEFALALLLVDGGCDLAHFAEQQVMREDIRALYPRIRRVPEERGGALFATVELLLADGGRVGATVIDPVGSRAKPLGLDDLVRKFDLCVAGLLSPDRAAGLRDVLERLPDLPDVAPLADALVSRVPAAPVAG
jgi:2-methylcitrate dehydratase PrpD